MTLGRYLIRAELTWTLVNARMLRPQRRSDAWHRYCRPTRHSADRRSTRPPHTQQPRLQAAARCTIITVTELSRCPSAISWFTY